MSRMRVRSGGLAVAGVAGLAMAVLIASPAMADTSQSSGTALLMALPGGGFSDSGQTTASNDGTTETNTGNPTPPLSVLGVQSLLTAGEIPQPSRAYSTGSSAACAGVVATGGTIEMDDSGSCGVSSPGTVVFNLGTVGGAAITLVAVLAYGYCRADTVDASGFASFSEATIESSLTGTLLVIPDNPSPDTVLNIPGIASVTLNNQFPSAGQLSLTALLFEPGATAGLATVNIGHVSCGPNGIAPPVPAIPVAGVPVAAGLVAILATGGFLWRRRRSLVRT